MDRIPDSDISNADNFSYLTSRRVKEDSFTTRIMGTFGASAVSSAGRSLNDHLQRDRKLQPQIFRFQLRLRMHAIAFSFDIGKMFKQILVN